MQTGFLGPGSSDPTLPDYAFFIPAGLGWMTVYYACGCRLLFVLRSAAASVPRA